MRYLTFGAGSNPFFQKRNQYEEELKKKGTCGYLWEGTRDKSHTHKCKKIKGHPGKVHVCNCSVTTRRQLKEKA